MSACPALTGKFTDPVAEAFLCWCKKLPLQDPNVALQIGSTLGILQGSSPRLDAETSKSGLNNYKNLGFFVGRQPLLDHQDQSL